MPLLAAASDVCILASAASTGSSNGASTVGSSSSGTLAFTGQDIVTAVCVAIALLVVGLLIVLLVRRRRDTEHSARTGTGSRLLAIILLAGLLGTALSLGSNSVPANAADEGSGCSLISFSIDGTSTGLETLVSGTPAKIMTVTLRNVSNGFINVSFASQVSSDRSGLASFVEVTGSCDCSKVPVLQSMLGSGVAGPLVRLAPNQAIAVRVSANLLPSVTNALQGTNTKFVLVAYAIEAA